MLILTFQNLEKLVGDLEERFDPITMPVLKGHCVSYCVQKYYLQGGSGFVFSRKAAEILFQSRSEWGSNVTFFDDYLASVWCSILKIDHKDTASGGFVGHFFPENEKQIIRNYEYHNLPDCPKKYRNHHCGNTMYRLNEISVTHDAEKGRPYPHYEGFTKAPSNIYFYMDTCYPKICKV